MSVADEPTILLPALNEAGCIADVLCRIPGAYTSNVLVVDGGSVDRTREVVKELGFQVVRQSGEGLGEAVRTGIDLSAGDPVIVLDADGSHSPADIPRFLEQVTAGADLVVGSRYSGGPEAAAMLSPLRRSSSDDDTPIRALGNRALTGLARQFCAYPLHDLLCGYKAFRRSLWNQLELRYCPGQSYDVEFCLAAHRAGYALTEVPIHEDVRIAGQSKLSALWDGTEILKVILRFAQPVTSGRRVEQSE